jgi:hypothetical protein
MGTYYYYYYCYLHFIKCKGKIKDVHVFKLAPWLEDAWNIEGTVS